MSVSASSVPAVVLAALGAVCFGLAAVRQHGAVRSTLGLGEEARVEPPARPALRERLALGAQVVRQPAWLLGAGQAGLGGLLHMVALALAPITLVQPVGVLAVPVTVARSALLRRRWPGRGQVLGTVLSVLGVAGLTLVLLAPAAQAPVLPTWGTLADAAAGVVVVAAGVALALRRAPALPACVGRAVVAAGLFGTSSVLVRVLGQVVTAGLAQHVGLVVVSLAALALVLPLGIWSMQSAYAVGAPQVVICCLTLADPVTAVVGGRYLLADGAAVTGSTLLAALGCGVVAAAGVVLLARDYPVEEARDQPSVPATGGGATGSRRAPQELGSCADHGRLPRTAVR